MKMNITERLKNVSVWIKTSSGRYQLNSDTLKEIPRQVEARYRNMIQEQEKL